MNILRWLLIVPIAIVGWYIGIFTAVGLYELNDQLCPAEYKVSGMCSAPWATYVQHVAIDLGSIISASLVVLLPALVAPLHNYYVARVAYILGLFFAIYFLFLSVWEPAIFAILGGGVMLYFTPRVLTLRSRGTPQKRGAPCILR